MSIPTDRDLLVSAAGNLLNAANGFEPLNATLARRLAAAVTNDKSFGVDYLSRTLMESESMAADWMPNKSAQQVAVPQGSWFDDLKFVQRVLEGHATGQDLDDALEATRRARKSIHALLLAAPHPPQAERVPMANSEIITAAESLGFTNSIAFLEVFEIGVECAEAHHHIGGKP